MNLHEYQAKRLFLKYDLPVLQGHVYSNKYEIEKYCDSYTKSNTIGSWVMKCQIHAGGRGKSGGVKLVRSIKDILFFFDKWFGKNLVTYQTSKDGELVNHILIEPAVKIIQEFYISILVDRDNDQIVCMASNQGGVNIETIGKNTPNLIHKIVINPSIGAYPYQGRMLACLVGLSGKKINEFSDIIVKAIKIFIEKDLLLLEINPLVITDNNNFICLDAKIIIDDNSIFRQSELLKICATKDKYLTIENNKCDMNYISLTGNIGCMVNGAGLAMATMDLLQTLGGTPANFLDIGGDVNKENIVSSFHMLLNNKKITAILVNIFGGIVCCDLIADSIITSLSIYDVHVPIVVRLEGNNAKLGSHRLTNSAFNITIANNLIDAIQTVISMGHETCQF